MRNIYNEPAHIPPLKVRKTKKIVWSCAKSEKSKTTTFVEKVKDRRDIGDTTQILPQ